MTWCSSAGLLEKKKEIEAKSFPLYLAPEAELSRPLLEKRQNWGLVWNEGRSWTIT